MGFPSDRLTVALHFPGSRSKDLTMNCLYSMADLSGSNRTYSPYWNLTGTSHKVLKPLPTHLLKPRGNAVGRFFGRADTANAKPAPRARSSRWG
jgi:hypothetical protein